jgi:TolB-like protein/Tfp pilus assembly protein PilF
MANRTIGYDALVGRRLGHYRAAEKSNAKELAVGLRRLKQESPRNPAPAPVRLGPRLSSFRPNRTLIWAVPATVLLLALVAILFFALRQRGVRRSRNLQQFEALAVLPLVNLSGDPAREYFADGMTEELITQLGKVTSARVISRQSIMQFKGAKTPLAEIAQKLKVDAVVEGSVLQSGSRVRVTARLVDAAAEKPVWADEYERDLQDVLSLQAEVTRAIANEIRMKLNPQEQAHQTTPRSVNPEAYDAYLKGRSQWYKISRQGINDAERSFQLALEKDPNYALAYAGLADVWMMRADAGYAAPSETLPKAKAAALKALQLDDTLSEAYVSLANIEAGYERDWSAAGQHFRRAIELNPNSADAHFMYADYLISLKREGEWRAEAQQAMNLDPMNSFLRCFYGWHLVYLGRYDEAIDLLQKVAAAQPSSAHLGLWGAYYRKHKEKEALEEAVKFYEALPDHEAVVAALRTGYQQAGYRAGMKRAADILADRAQHSHVAGVRIARLYAHAGDADRALFWLEKAYEARETPLVHLGVAWDWDRLLPDPRFQDLVRRMNFPQ